MTDHASGAPRADGDAAIADGVLLETRPADGVACLRLNRPAVLNALDLALRRALATAFTRLDADAGVRAIVATLSQAICMRCPRCGSTLTLHRRE